MQDSQHSPDSPLPYGRDNKVPEGATPVDMEELFAAIGELYLQVRIQRRTIQKLSERSGIQLESSTN